MIVLFDIFLLTISVVILPHLNYTNFMSPRGYTGTPGSLAAGFVGAIAVAVLLRLKPNQRQTWGILVLVFSILGFFGFGGFIVGSVLGIVGGIMTLRWKPPSTASTTSPQ